MAISKKDLLERIRQEVVEWLPKLVVVIDGLLTTRFEGEEVVLSLSEIGLNDPRISNGARAKLIEALIQAYRAQGWTVAKEHNSQDHIEYLAFS